VRRIALLLLILALAAWFAGAEELLLFTGEAEVSLEDMNIEAAKRKATEIALAQAIEKALEHVAPPEELALKKDEIKARILKSPKRYIASFTILIADERETNYELALEARIRIEELRKAVREIVVVPPRERDKKPELVIISYRKQGTGYALDTEFNEQLRERFDLANRNPAPHETAEQLLGSPTFAEAAEQKKVAGLARAAAVQNLRLLLLVDLIDETDPEQVDEACDQTARITIVDTGEEVIVESFGYQFPTEGACEQHREVGARNLFGRVLDSLTSHGLVGQSGDAELIVEAVGITDYAHLQELQALLRNRSYVESATLRSFEPGGRVQFKVVYGGPVKQFISELEKSEATSFKLKFSGRRGNFLQYTVEYR